jgi:hypothetical protein
VSLVAGLGSVACGDAEGEGALAFTTYGEDFIEQGIPATEFADGWSVRYEKFLVVLRDVRVSEAGGKVAAEDATSRLFDMTKPGDKAVVSFDGLPAKAYPNVGFRIGPVDANTEVSAATEEDKALLLATSSSIYVAGFAERGSVRKTFRWAFDTDTVYDECRAEVAGREVSGVVVTNGGRENVQITLHGDHLFYDDLQGDDAKLRFDAMAAADGNDDGEVTLDELAAVELATLPPERYGTGSASGIGDLRAFVTALTRTIGHFRGEGECVSRGR